MTLFGARRSLSLSLLLSATSMSLSSSHHAGPLPFLHSTSVFIDILPSLKPSRPTLRANISHLRRTAHVVSFARRFRWTDLQPGDFHSSRQQDLKTTGPQDLKTARPQRSGSSPLRGAQCGRAESRDGCVWGGELRVCRAEVKGSRAGTSHLEGCSRSIGRRREGVNLWGAGGGVVFSWQDGREDLCVNGRCLCSIIKGTGSQSIYTRPPNNFKYSQIHLLPNPRILRSFIRIPFSFTYNLVTSLVSLSVVMGRAGVFLWTGPLWRQLLSGILLATGASASASWTTTIPAASTSMVVSQPANGAQYNPIGLESIVLVPGSPPRYHLTAGSSSYSRMEHAKQTSVHPTELQPENPRLSSSSSSYSRMRSAHPPAHTHLRTPTRAHPPAHNTKLAQSEIQSIHHWYSWRFRVPDKAAQNWPYHLIHHRSWLNRPDLYITLSRSIWLRHNYLHLARQSTSLRAKALHSRPNSSLELRATTVPAIGSPIQFPWHSRSRIAQHLAARRWHTKYASRSNHAYSRWFQLSISSATYSTFLPAPPEPQNAYPNLSAATFPNLASQYRPLPLVRRRISRLP
ncbi:hypothetical protein C8R45DRAFT_924698 [Mycena sanguinolenta]|nr:hypothetical protein C8R45DRAFT_924698 [Mycena sanguinolenta]